MQTSELYRQRAAECERMAEKRPGEREHTALGGFSSSPGRPFRSRTQWHTVGGWLRSIQQTRRPVAGSSRQTVRACSTNVVPATACWIPDAMPTCMAFAEAGIRQKERVAAVAIAARCFRMGA